MAELLEKLQSVGVSAAELGALVVALAVNWAPVIAWIGWWLFLVDWRSVWPAVLRGGWAALALLAAGGALVWNASNPGPVEIVGWVGEGYLGKLWVSLAVAFSAVFCGLIQRLVLPGPPRFWAEEAAPAAVQPQHGQH